MTNLEDKTINELAEEYQRFIDSIDNSIAGVDEYGSLAWHIDCSAQANANDTVVEKGIKPFTTDAEREFWICALVTAILVLDDWKNYFPQLVIDGALPSTDY